MAKKSSTGTKVTRISASHNAKKPAATKVVKYDQSEKVDADPTEMQRQKGKFFTRLGKKTTRKPSVYKEEKSTKNPLVALGRYFAGAWHELREVRWPTRRATWGMTGALLGFTAFFVVIILLLDALFQWLFKLVLGS